MLKHRAKKPIPVFRQWRGHARRQSRCRKVLQDRRRFRLRCESLPRQPTGARFGWARGRRGNALGGIALKDRAGRPETPMHTPKLMLALLGGGAVLGALGGLAVDTTMKPPPAPSWRHVSQPPASGQDSYQFVDSGPEDLSPAQDFYDRIPTWKRHFHDGDPGFMAAGLTKPDAGPADSRSDDLSDSSGDSVNPSDEAADGSVSAVNGAGENAALVSVPQPAAAAGGDLDSDPPRPGSLAGSAMAPRDQTAAFGASGSSALPPD
jgi:hypothetical protein